VVARDIELSAALLRDDLMGKGLTAAKTARSRTWLEHRCGFSNSIFFGLADLNLPVHQSEG
jgi:hypothetical protein